MGYGEIKRQLFESTVMHGGHQHRRRAEGDGHDNIWPKLLEFLFALPFVVGFQVGQWTQLSLVLPFIDCFQERRPGALVTAGRYTLPTHTLLTPPSPHHLKPNRTQTKIVSRLLAATLIFESLFYWQFWRHWDGLNHWYVGVSSLSISCRFQRWTTTTVHR